MSYAEKASSRLKSILKEVLSKMIGEKDSEYSQIFFSKADKTKNANIFG